MSYQYGGAVKDAAADAVAQNRRLVQEVAILRGELATARADAEKLAERRAKDARAATLEARRRRDEWKAKAEHLDRELSRWQGAWFRLARRLGKSSSRAALARAVAAEREARMCRFRIAELKAENRMFTDLELARSCG